MKRGLIAIGFLVAGFTITILINSLNKADDVENQQVAQGVEVIKQLESQDVVEVQEKIESIKAQNGISEQVSSATTDETSEPADYKKIFSSSVIAGDSRAEGISGYGVLNQSSVVAQKGRSLSTAVQNGDIDTVIRMYPKNVFLTYGINDAVGTSSSDAFIKLYGEVIDKLKSKLPNTNIYVCSIMPVTSNASNRQPNLRNIAQWNQDLKSLCEEKGVTYIDASGVIAPSDYAQDGIHFGVNCIKKWLDLFIQQANL